MEVNTMAIIRQHDKRSGITYVYESSSYWDKEKKMTRAKRKLIGRLDPETGEIMPTDGRGRKPKIPKTVETDFEKLYHQLQKKYEAQNILIESLQEELKKYKNR